MYLLQAQIGIAFLAPLIVSCMATGFTAYLTPKITAVLKTWMEAIQSRVSVTSDMLGSMRSVNVLGLTGVVQSLVQELRVREVGKVRQLLKLQTWRILFGNSTNLVSPLATFAVFVVVARTTGQTLNTSTAYTALSLISIIDAPLNSLITSFPMILASVTCFDRIQRFLRAPSRRDHRLILTAADDSGTSGLSVPRDGAGVRDSDVELQSLQPLRPQNASIALTDDALVVQNGSFGWAYEHSPVLHDISFRVKASSFVIIIGPTGCGKSTLLKGLLGETPTSQGFVYTTNLRAAFADQDSWIQNGTFRSNLLGNKLYEQQWYSEVVHACALDVDVLQLPDGDHTVVGSRGISLSGGQKQRLAMARAVYSKQDILFLDDVFSGLDVDTEERIFSRLLGPQGLLKRCSTTVILVTHAARRLVYADHIIALSGGGSVAEQGTFESLRQSNGYVQSLAAKLKEINDAAPEELARGMPQPPTADPAINSAASDLARMTGDWKIYRHYFASMGWSSSCLFFIWTTLQGILGKLPELLLVWWTDAVRAHGNSVNSLYISVFAALSFGSLLTMFLALYQLLVIMLPKSARDLHSSLLKTVINAPISFFSSADSGQTLK